MQIRTITCHDVYNHGASLQAYALQTYLESLGHEVRIIDYKPDYLNNHYKLWSVSNPVYDKPFVKQAYLLAKLPGRLITLKRKKAFDQFTRQYLKLTERYHSNEELKQNPPKADVYIAGSDQIWSTTVPTGHDASFYLNFGLPGTRRLSYAASFGTKVMSDEVRPFIKGMLRNFDAISVRESCTLPLLSELGVTNGVSVCDPVFLLPRISWESILPVQRFKDKYLLVYDLEGSHSIKELAIKIAKQNNLKIYNIGFGRLDYTDKDFWASDPIMFLCLIRDAQFVIANSFHACAFSLIFERNFVAINRTDDDDDRIGSLLHDLGLERNMISNTSNVPLISTDYKAVNKVKEEIIQSSKDYLARRLS